MILILTEVVVIKVIYNEIVEKIFAKQNSKNLNSVSELITGTIIEEPLRI